MNDRKEQDDQQEPPTSYEPPLAEDIETSHEPAEAVAGIGSPGRLGVEESDRWH